MRTILLGAGASAEAGVPTAKPMAQRIYSSLKEDSVTAKAIEVAIGGLQFHRSIAQGDPFGDIDVEDLYEILRTLGDRHNGLIAPFVGSWSHAVSSAESAELNAVAARAVNGLERDVDRAISNAVHSGISRGYADFSAREFGMWLSEALNIAAGKNDNSFAHAAQKVLRTLARLSWVDDTTKVKYMLPLIASASKAQLWVATLNYDNVLERAAEELKVDIDIGILKYSPAVRFHESAKVCVAKLHGSVNWLYDYQQNQWLVKDEPFDAPELIFGSGNKLRIYGPYLDLLFAFRARLEQSDELHVCGYSFRDPHINYLIVNWLHRDNNRNMLAVDPHLSLAQIERSMNQSIAPHGVILKSGSLSEKIQIEKLTAGDWIASM